MANNQTATLALLFSDFTDNFNKAPFSDDLAKITNENSVKQSIKNICRTYLGERLYDNTIGQSGDYGLFGLDDGLAATIVKTNLMDALKQNEPRATILDIIVDTKSVDHGMIVTVIFMVQNNPNPLSTQIILERVR